MTRYTYKPEETSDRVIIENSLDLHDRFGREIGYVVETYTVEWIACEHQYGAFSTQDEAHAAAAERNARPFALRLQATRDNRRYGAWQQPRYFATEAARDAAFGKYVADATKRATRKVK